MAENSSDREAHNQDNDENTKLYVGMEFESEEAAKTLYDAYARRVGFSTHVVLRIERKDLDSWVVTKFVEDHNHSMVSPRKVHHLRPRRHFAGATKNVVETVDAPSDVFVSMDGNHVSYDPNRGVRSASPVETNSAAKSFGPMNYVQPSMTALRDGARKIADVKKNVAKVTPPSSQGSGSTQEDCNKKTPISTFDTSPPLWPWQDVMPQHFNLNDVGVPIADLNQPTIAPTSVSRDDGPDKTVVLTCFKSMTWVIEDKNSTSSKVAVINLKLQDYGKTPSGETEVQFRLTKVTLEPMLKSMAYISQQLSASANRVAVINLKLQDTKTTTGETEVKFQVSRDTLGSMLRSMAYIREQL
ncbi:FAR1-related sequence 3 [Actinidia rufa]|uniref:FAR1-related sequence 3 n=1 Tax=Actinidia rufa TaxID=165716 RepID=A0A7J0F7T3_9ERIC|nr:FAR1-related sequence 3 [Actinidia rufa]